MILARRDFFVALRRKGKGEELDIKCVLQDPHEVNWALMDDP